MSEFSNRVEAQREILRIVNSGTQTKEPLLALNEKAVHRWSAANRVDDSSTLLQLLHRASSRIFAMANHSDDPISGAYRISSRELSELGLEIRSSLQA